MMKILRTRDLFFFNTIFVPSNVILNVTCTGERDMNLTFENPCPGQANGLSSYYFTQAVHMLLASHCMLGNPDDYPKDFGNSIEDDEHFDFVIVGGGSAGSVVASRLSEITKWRVLLIEAGENPTFESDIPGFGLSLPGRDLDWKFAANKSDKSCLGMEDETCAIFQGKVLGGTSTINKMHYLRGNPRDYDEWESLGNRGWGYKHILEFFKKSEKLDEDFKIIKETNYEEEYRKLKKAAGEDERKLQQLSKLVPGKFHSKSGMLSVNHFTHDVTLSRLKKGLWAAAEELGVPHVADINGKTQIGFVRAMGAIHEGNRGNSAKAFLTPVKDRKNLFVMKNTTVEGLVFDGYQVTGVRFTQNGKTKTVFADKEVIVSAGAINSPRLLLLSGIGPASHLKKFGIKVVRDLPGVGENLQSHISFFGLPVVVDKSTSKAITHLQKIDAMYHFISRGTGFFGNVGLNDVVGFVNTHKNSSVPDVGFFHYLNHLRDYYTFNELLISLKIKNEIRDQFAKAYAKSSLMLICPTLLRPKSRGKVELTGPRFHNPPKIISNFLNEEADVDALIRGIKFGLELVEAKAFEGFEPELLKLEVEGCKHLGFQTREYWECLVRHLSSSTHDVAGTCKMGPEEDSSAVVDPELKVHGVKGLRVVDSSVMPHIVRGSTSIASIMIAEKVSHLIKEEWRKTKHTEL